MRLLSQKEVKQALQEEEERLHTRNAATIKAVQSEEKKLNDLRSAFALAEVELRKQAELSRLAYKEAEEDILRELATLETKRKALAYSTDEQRLRERENAVKMKETDIASKDAFYVSWKEELEGIEQSLEKRINAVEAKLLELTHLEKEFNKKEQDLDKQTERSFTILAGLEAREDVVSCKEKELALRLEAFQAKTSQEEFALRQLEASLVLAQEQIRLDRIALQDAYATLERTKKRLHG